MTASLALLASVIWGTSDFLGGTLSRRLPTLAVLAAGQAVAVLALLPTVLATGSSATGPVLGLAALAGSSWALAMAAFYRALAVGTMGVVAPVASTGLAVPVAVALVQGERPSALQGLAVLAALAGVVAAAGPDLRRHTSSDRRVGVQPLLLAFAAAGLFGAELALLGRCAALTSSGGVTASLLAMRVGALTCVLLAAAVTRTRVTARPARLVGPAVLGLLDLAATAAYAVAAANGRLAVVAVLASLYPAVTALLAHRVHGERLAPVQATGVVVVVGAAACLGLGGAA